MAQFTQKSGVEIRFSIKDAAGNPYLPETAHWRLVDDATDTVMQDWTEVTPAATYVNGTLTAVYATVEIPGPINVMTNSAKSRERKVVPFVVDKDTDREFSPQDETDYYLVRGKR